MGAEGIGVEISGSSSLGPPILSPPARCPSPQWGHRHHGQLHGKHTFTGFPQRAAAGNGLSEEEGTSLWDCDGFGF